jgi:hypothetical protein
MRLRSAALAVAFLCGIAIGTEGCGRQAQSAAPTGQAAMPAGLAPTPSRDHEPPVRDLSIDEGMGGHTLARHVGKTDAELAARLRREPQIASASTYTDRESAERAVGAALADNRGRVASWANRSGPRPNLVLHFSSDLAVGRTLSRGRPGPVESRRVLVVLRWLERSKRFYVLTSYPEVNR